MIVGTLLTGYLSDIVGPGRMWLGTGLIAAGYLPLPIYAATPASIAGLLLGFGLSYGATYAVITIYLSPELSRFGGDEVAVAVGGGTEGVRAAVEWGDAVAQTGRLALDENEGTLGQGPFDLHTPIPAVQGWIPVPSDKYT